MNNKNPKMILETFSEDSADIYLYKHKVHTNIIYIVTLAAICICIALLPFLYVDITVSALGNIRPMDEKTTVTASMTEIVDSVYVREGQKLNKGDIILTLRTTKNLNRQDYHLELLQEVDSKIADLKFLTEGIVPKKFSSREIYVEYNHYISQRHQIATDLEQYRIEWERNKSLYDLGLISESEYNKYYYQYIGKKNELAVIESNQESIWQNNLYNLSKERKEYYSAGNDLKTDRQLYEVRSPVSGSLDYFIGIYKGSSINAGQQIAIISPDGEVCLDAYVMPRDIAFIETGQKVRIQVDALNYIEWGTLNGKVVDISSDMIDDGKGSYFYKVKCIMESDYLTLKRKDRKAFIKKGMSATAHFIVTRKSLFTLIYNDINEWANPTQYKNEIYLHKTT